MSDVNISQIEQMTRTGVGGTGTHITEGRAVVIEGLHIRIAELEAQVAALTEDKERLDWMEAQMTQKNCWLPGFNRYTRTWFVVDESENEPTFRSALDSARKAGE